MTVLCSRNKNNILRVFDNYKILSGKDITGSIKSQMSGDLKDALLAIVKCIRNFAERLYKSMKGLWTVDNMLIRVMVSPTVNLT